MNADAHPPPSQSQQKGKKATSCNLHKRKHDKHAKKTKHIHHIVWCIRANQILEKSYKTKTA